MTCSPGSSNDSSRNGSCAGIWSELACMASCSATSRANVAEPEGMSPSSWSATGLIRSLTCWRRWLSSLSLARMMRSAMRSAPSDRITLSCVSPQRPTIRNASDSGGGVALRPGSSSPWASTIRVSSVSEYRLVSGMASSIRNPWSARVTLSLIEASRPYFATSKYMPYGPSRRLASSLFRLAQCQPYISSRSGVFSRVMPCGGS